MTDRKDWFVIMNPLMQNMVNFTNDNTLEAEGVGDFLIIRKDGKRSVISKCIIYTKHEKQFSQHMTIDREELQSVDQR